MYGYLGLEDWNLKPTLVNTSSFSTKVRSCLSFYLKPTTVTSSYSFFKTIDEVDIKFKTNYCYFFILNKQIENFINLDLKPTTVTSS